MKIITKLTILAILIIFSVFSPCIFAQNPPPPPEADNILITGQVQHLSYDGGFYGIVGDDGTQYKPLNLPDSYQIESLHVKVVARLNTKKLLTHGWGTPIDIIDIERIR